eukprot:TRINITY_DN67347_c0_g1_i1.p1 TRINITY_DN67347_c0_g1~~TRINITY_DN67347_c0_g1_i1.p1  ORF type:complete len:430 (-),score=45.57 TRINITY_DN67347_c0_g1_i1:28-1317(-)
MLRCRGNTVLIEGRAPKMGRLLYLMIMCVCFVASGTGDFQTRASKLFLDVEGWAKHSVAEAETTLSEAIASARNESFALRRVYPTDHVISRSKIVVQNVWANIFINACFLIPCLSIGGPLFWIWYHLEPSEKPDVIFTATDSDLREVQIREIGASGVALLRRQPDRHTGIMFAFTGIMLQTVFLYFIAVSCVLRLNAQFTPGDNAKPTPLILLFCSLFCNTMVCCSSYIVGLKCLATKAPDGYEHLHQVLVLLDSFVIPGMCTIVGDLYLCTSDGISSLVFNATAMGFIISMNMQIAGLMSWSLAGHGGRAFQPGNVSIKDQQNSSAQARYSFVASLVVASVIMPIGLLAGMVIIVVVILASIALPFFMMGQYMEYYDSVDSFRAFLLGGCCKLIRGGSGEDTSEHEAAVGKTSPRSPSGRNPARKGTS